MLHALSESRRSLTLAGSGCVHRSRARVPCEERSHIRTHDAEAWADAVWHVEPGATVSVGQPVFDVETEKVTSECAAEIGGILKRQVAAKGTTLPVGVLVAVIAVPEASDADVDRFIAEFKPELQV